METFLIRAHIRLPETARAVPIPERPLTTYSATPAQQGRTQAWLLRKWKLSERIQELHKGGMSLCKIGEELGVARNTVRKYFRQPQELPLPTPRLLRVSKLDSYEDSILMCLSQGCINAAQIHREITDMGFSGGRSNVKAYVAYLRKSTADGAAPVKRSERAQALQKNDVWEGGISALAAASPSRCLIFPVCRSWDDRQRTSHRFTKNQEEPVYSRH